MEGIYCNMTRAERKNGEFVWEKKMELATEILSKTMSEEEIAELDIGATDIYQDISDRMDAGIEAMKDTYDSQTTVFYI